MNFEIQTTVMAQDDARQLAFDEACNFFSDEQICTRYGLSVKQLAGIRAQPSFQALVHENERLLQDDGSEFLIKAKEYAMDALTILHRLAKSKNTSGTVRHKAAVSLLEYARIPTGGKVDSGGQAQQPMIINTNLQLNQQPGGVYTVEAMAEHPNVKQIGATAPPPPAIEYVEEDDDENLDLVS